MAYPDQAVALVVVKSEAGITTSDRDDVLNIWLVASRGVLPDKTIEYRPHVIAAYAMHTSKGEQTVQRAEGDAVFRQSSDSVNLQPAIEGQLRAQQGLDVSQSTEVPPGWDTNILLDSLCGCRDSGQASGSGVLFVGMVG